MSGESLSMVWSLQTAAARVTVRTENALECAVLTVVCGLSALAVNTKTLLANTYLHLTDFHCPQSSGPAMPDVLSG